MILTELGYVRYNGNIFDGWKFESVVPQVSVFGPTFFHINGNDSGLKDGGKRPGGKRPGQKATPVSKSCAFES